MAQYMKVEEYINKYFVDGSKPDKRTIIKAIGKDLPGAKIGSQYFVDVEPLQVKPKTGNKLADKILQSIGSV